MTPPVNRIVSESPFLVADRQNSSESQKEKNVTTKTSVLHSVNLQSNKWRTAAKLALFGFGIASSASSAYFVQACVDYKNDGNIGPMIGFGALTALTGLVTFYGMKQLFNKTTQNPVIFEETHVRDNILPLKSLEANFLGLIESEGDVSQNETEKEENKEADTSDSTEEKEVRQEPKRLLSEPGILPQIDFENEEVKIKQINDGHPSTDFPPPDLPPVFKSSDNSDPNALPPSYLPPEFNWQDVLGGLPPNELYQDLHPTLPPSDLPPDLPPEFNEFNTNAFSTTSNTLTPTLNTNDLQPIADLSLNHQLYVGLGEVCKEFYERERNFSIDVARVIHLRDFLSDDKITNLVDSASKESWPAFRSALNNLLNSENLGILQNFAKNNVGVLSPLNKQLKKSLTCPDKDLASLTYAKQIIELYKLPDETLNAFAMYNLAFSTILSMLMKETEIQKSWESLMNQYKVQNKYIRVKDPTFGGVFMVIVQRLPQLRTLCETLVKHSEALGNDALLEDYDLIGAAKTLTNDVKDKATKLNSLMPKVDSTRKVKRLSLVMPQSVIPEASINNSSPSVSGSIKNSSPTFKQKLKNLNPLSARGKKEASDKEPKKDKGKK